MNQPSRLSTVVLLTIVCLLCVGELWAWQPAASSPTASQQIVFNPPIEGTCRAESGSVSRGRLVSISELEIVMINPQNRRVNFPTSGIRTIRTKDGEFQYEPGSDDFSDAIRRASALDGVEIAQVYNQAPTQPPANQPGVAQGNSGFTNPNRPPTGVNTPPSGNQPQVNAPVYSSTPGFSNGPPAGTATTPAATDDSSLRCASCGKVISADSRIGQTCPHCGVVWVANPTYRPSVADTSSSHPGYASTQSVNGTTNAGTSASSSASAPSSSAPAPAVGAGGNFSFETMPLWQKAGAFVGFLAVLYLVVSSRR